MDGSCSCNLSLSFALHAIPSLGDCAAAAGTAARGCGWPRTAGRQAAVECRGASAGHWRRAAAAPPPPLVGGRGSGPTAEGGGRSVDDASSRLPRRGCGGHKVPARAGAGVSPPFISHTLPPRQFVVDARRPNGWRRVWPPASLCFSWREGVADVPRSCLQLPAGLSLLTQSFFFPSSFALFFLRPCGLHLPPPAVSPPPARARGCVLPGTRTHRRSIHSGRVTRPTSAPTFFFSSSLDRSYPPGAPSRRRAHSSPSLSSLSSRQRPGRPSAALPQRCPHPWRPP